MSGRQWTPFQVHIVLHHHASFAKFERWTAPIYEGTVAELVTIGVLQAFDKPRHENDESMIGTTDLGNALVEMWLQTPLPRSVIIDPRDGKQVMVETTFHTKVPDVAFRDYPGTKAAQDGEVPDGTIVAAEGWVVEPEPTYPVTKSTLGERVKEWPH